MITHSSPVFRQLAYVAGLLVVSATVSFAQMDSAAVNTTAVDPNAPVVQKVTRVGGTITPPGANYSITALQDIHAGNPTGAGSFAPQVNHDFEFAGSTGVSYQDSKGNLKDFGIGLYDAGGHTTRSSGLRIDYTAPVLASSVTITVEDFDINTNATFYNSGKVEPGMLILGPGGTVIATATPTQIFPTMHNAAAPGSKVDIWTINLGDLFNQLSLADGPVSGVVLFADAANGEQPNSDPYLLISVSNGQQVPEPAAWALLGIGALVATFRFRSHKA